MLKHINEQEKTKIQSMPTNMECVILPSDLEYKVLHVEFVAIEFAREQSGYADGLRTYIESVESIVR